VGTGRVFGAELAALVDDEHAVPLVLEKLLISVEVHGLFCEGLYRKSGALAQAKQVRRAVEASDGTCPPSLSLPLGHMLPFYLVYFYA